MAQAAIPLISSIGSAAIGAKSQSSALGDEQARREEMAKMIGEFPEGFKPEEVFGTKPKFKEVPYDSLSMSDPGFKKHVAGLLKANLANVPGAQKLFDSISQGITSTMKKRATMFDPRFLSTLNQVGQNAALASRGRLSQEDTYDIIGRQGELGSLLGGGPRRPQTNQDLGIARNTLSNQVAPGLLAQMSQIFGQIDPLQAHMGANPANMMLTPSQTLPLSMQENQWGTTYNRAQEDERMYLNAMADPTQAGLFNMNRQAVGYLAAPYANATPAGQYGGGGGMAGAAQTFLGQLPSMFPGNGGGGMVSQSSPVSAPMGINRSAPIFRPQGGGFFGNLFG